MAEVTRVPLKPVRKGALAKLWLGVIALVLLGVGIAYLTVPQGVAVKTLVEGKGESPTKTDVVLVDYVGKLKDGKVFDQQKSAPLELSSMIPGFAEGITKMKKGGKYEMTIPAALAYGAAGNGPIPPNSDLTFEITLIDFISEAEYQQRMQMMQQLQQMQGAQGAQGAPGGAGGGAGGAGGGAGGAQ